MNTIYNLLNPSEPISKGVIEIFARGIIDYDMNNYGYKEMYTLVSNNMANSKNLHLKTLYHGVTM